jgi:signal transduction histidine kinase
MASLPVLLVPPPAALSLATAESAPSYAGLGLMWLAALGALATTGLALRSTIASAVQTSRFASSVTHELRTPLTTFRLYAEMLSDDMVRDPDQRRTYLNTLRDESGRLGFLVENVLTWSRVEEGRASIEPRRISAGELVSAAEPLLRRRCQEAGATFELQLTTDAIYTAADADRVRQVLFNLVDNACKYAGQGATVKLSSETHDKHLVLAVDDDGPGVATSLRRRIFSAFDRGTRGPGDSVRGLGLGLAISRELARSLGGDMQCTTSALGGARFELRLPLLT